MEWQHSSSCRRRVSIQRLSDDHERFVEKGLTAVNGDGLCDDAPMTVRPAHFTQTDQGPLPSHELCAKPLGRRSSQRPRRRRAGRAHQNTARNRFINRTIDVVDGQDNTPFVCAVMAAEGTSLVTNLGTG